MPRPVSSIRAWRRERGRRALLPGVYLIAALAVLLLAGSACAIGSGNASPVATTSWSCPNGGSKPGVPGSAVGVQFHGAWTDYTDAQRAVVLDTFASTGLGWVRIDATWSELQPRAADDWDAAALRRLDTAIDMARSRHLEVLVTLLNTPEWAGGGSSGTRLPDAPAAYAAAAGHLVERYGGRVAAWEVWNEPNSQDFAAGADPAAYAALLRAAYPAVKAADPRALVVFGGLQYNDEDFLARAYAAGAGGAFDVMATHPYPAPSDAAPSAADDGSIYALGHIRALHAVMLAHGDGDLPVWFTELGWSTHANTGQEPGYERGVTDRQQADYLVRTLTTVRTQFPYVARVFWYAERDRTRGGPQIAHFGLLTTALTPKPAARALACLLRSP